MSRTAIQLVACLVGVLFVLDSLRAMRTGVFRAARRRHGWHGVDCVTRQERPLAFWLCATSYLVVGTLTIIVAIAWL